MTHWKRTIFISRDIEAAGDDESKIPALLLSMASAVRPDDSGFADELVEASENVTEIDNPREEADFWLAQLYDWADTVRVWVA